MSSGGLWPLLGLTRFADPMLHAGTIVLLLSLAAWLRRTVRRQVVG